MTSFNEDGLKKKLDGLNASQQSIQTMALWLIHHKKHAHTIVNIWYKEVLKGSEDRKLCLMYLANDVIQNGKRKGPEYHKEFSQRLPKVFKHLSTALVTEKYIHNVNRLINVWEERLIFKVEVIEEFRKRLGKNDEQDSGSAEKKRAHSDSETKSHPRKVRIKSIDIDSINKDEFPSAFETDSNAQSGTSASAAFSPDSGESEEVVAEVKETTPVKIVEKKEEIKDVPDMENLMAALQDLENAATADADVRKRIAGLPPAVSDVNGIAKIKDKKTRQFVEEKVNEALEILHTYNDRLNHEMTARKSVDRLLHAFISHQKDLLSKSEETTEMYRIIFLKLQKVRHEIRAHLQNLPDISKLPNLGGSLQPLPSAGDLFT